MKNIILLFFGCLTLACKDDSPTPNNQSNLYFPPTSGSTWETVTPSSLGWNTSAISDFKTYLSNNNTRAFIILKDGKIAMEEYFGTAITGGGPFGASSIWYWASAGKTLTSACVGIANAQGKINFDAKTSDYLGTGWSSLTASQENKITVRHQLTMTTGLDDGVPDADCTDKSCFVYKADAGTRWAYHTAPYTLLDNVIATTTGKDVNAFVNEQIETKIGMDGSFIKTGENNVFYSTPRSMARFGLLLLNKGKWNQTQVIPPDHFNLMTTTSQNINLSYGYLTWLNGKASSMVPQSQIVFNQSISPNAPSDLFAAMGKNGQLINVVPAKGLVVIRLGDAPDNSLVPFKFQDAIWVELNKVIR